MTTITIPKTLIKEKELVLIPRREYEEFSRWQKTTKPFKSFKPTLAQKKALSKARKNFANGKFLTIDELKRKLGFTN